MSIPTDVVGGFEVNRPDGLPMHEVVDAEEGNTTEIIHDIGSYAVDVARAASDDTLDEDDEYIEIPPADNTPPKPFRPAGFSHGEEGLFFASSKSRRTRDSTDALSIYLKEMGKTSLLTAEEEVKLAKAIEETRKVTDRVSTGDSPPTRQDKKAIRDGSEAKERFIKSNLRLVVSVARRYPLTSGLELLDLIQEGNLGLEHAVDKYDWRRGFKFSTYATFWIRQSIGRALDQKSSLIRVPGDRSSGLRAALRANNGQPDGLSEEYQQLYALTTSASLNKQVGGDGEIELGDLLASEDTKSNPEASLMALADSDEIETLLITLNNRSRFAVEARFGILDGECKSFKEVGNTMGITSEAARRLVMRALIELRGEAARLSR